MNNKERIGHTVGVNSGAGVTETWSGLLRANGKKKLTDKQLLAKMKKEFPKRKEFQPIGRIRSFFNRGVMGYGNPAGANLRGTPKESFAYDAAGNVTRSTEWSTGRKVDPKRSAAAKKRAAAQYKGKPKKTKPAKKKPAKAAKPAKPAKPAQKKTIKLKVHKKAA